MSRKPPKFQSSRLSRKTEPQQPARKVTTTEAVKDLLGVSESTSEQGTATATVEKPVSRPKKRFVERTFRLDQADIKALTRIRDRYNADRPDDAERLTLDEIGRLMARHLIENPDHTQLIEHLRRSSS